MSYIDVLPRVCPIEGPNIVKEVRAFMIAGVYQKEDVNPPKQESDNASSDNYGDDQHWMSQTPVATPLSWVQDLKCSRRSWNNQMGSLIVEVELYGGIVGVGVSTGGVSACFIVEEHLARFVEGQDVHNIELMWDTMHAATIGYGVNGLSVHALSAIDLALWDALGKVLNEPVYNLIGGKTKDALPLYAVSNRPDFAQTLDFKGCKIPLAYGPADGIEGMNKNIEHLKRVRAVVGNELLIILDCFMSLSVPYAIDLVQRISKEVPGGVMCLEEIMMPQAYDEMAEVKAKVGHLVQFSTGEHEYGLRAFKSILEKKCADMIQPNITVCGGLTEARRICSLARAFDIPVIFHGSSSFSYHIQFALKSCPYGELLLVCPEASTISPLFGNLFLDEPLPVNGYIRLPNKPGFGLTLNKENIFVRPCERTPPPFHGVEAEKGRRTISQSEWLRMAERTVPLGSPPRALVRSGAF